MAGTIPQTHRNSDSGTPVAHRGPLEITGHSGRKWGRFLELGVPLTKLYNSALILCALRWPRCCHQVCYALLNAYSPFSGVAMADQSRRNDVGTVGQVPAPMEFCASSKTLFFTPGTGASFEV